MQPITLLSYVRKHSIAGGNIPGSHGGIVSEFGRIYVMSGEISRDIGRKLSHALEMRESEI